MRFKFFFLFVFAIICLHLFHLFFLHFDEKFKPHDFEHGFKKSYSTEVSGLDYKKLDSFLSQPFHYLGHGKQMIAFESQDKKFVIKFFNPMRPLKNGWYKRWKFWQRYSSLKWIKREWFQKEARLKKLFKRHKIAYENLQSETGLVFVHLSPSKKMNYYLHVTDNRGKKHVLSLATTPFVLQEKATLVPQHLFGLLQRGDKAGVKAAIAALEQLFDKRLACGITDRIQTMNNNYGFVGDRPIQIDVGRIRVDEDLKNNPSEERDRILSNFHSWVNERFPEINQEPLQKGHQSDFLNR